MKTETRLVAGQFTAVIVASCFAGAVEAGLIDFEAVADGVGVGATYSDIVFSNAIVVRSGLSLNDLEFPPRSGEAVAFDDGGPMVVTFQTPVDLFSGYFTYSTKMALTAFDGFGALVAQRASLFDSNLAISGQAGSVPNELIELMATGIRSVVLTGDPAGGSFTVDDLFYRPTSAAHQVPEPSTLDLMTAWLMVIVALGGLRRCRNVTGPDASPEMRRFPALA